MEEKLIQMESSDSIILSNNTTMCTSIGWYCDMHIQDTYETFTKFLINAPNPQKNKKWISSTNVIQMDTYPKFGMYTSIDDTSDFLESNGCTLIIASEFFVDVILHSFSANGFEDLDNLRYYQGGRLTARQRRNFTSTRFIVVSPYFFEKNKNIMKNEYWTRIVVCGIENISLLQKLTTTYFRHDFLWIISPLLNFGWIQNPSLGSRNFHHGFGITKVPTWFKLLIDKRILQYIVVYSVNRTHLWKPELIRVLRYNSYESDTSVRFHVENTDYDRALQCVNNVHVESFESFDTKDEEIECGVCLDNLTKDSTILCKTSCNHYFCKKCITQWFIRNYQCPTCRTSEPTMLYIKNYEPTNKTKYTKVLSFLRYISMTGCTIDNSIVLYNGNYHETRDYFTTNFYKYQLNGSYDFLRSQNTKRVFLLDAINDQNDLLSFFKVNFPHIEEYVIFDYKPFDILRDWL